MRIFRDRTKNDEPTILVVNGNNGSKFNAKIIISLEIYFTEHHSYTRGWSGKTILCQGCIKFTYIFFLL